MLCDLLANTGQAGRPQSYYRGQDIERRARGYGLHADSFANPVDFDRAYLHAVLREGRGDASVFGLRVMWGTIAEMAERLRPLRPALRDGALFEDLFGPLTYVHVRRRDKLAQAISLLKAEQTGLWHLAADGSERQRTGPPAHARYDAGRIAELVSALERDDSAWIAFFSENGIVPVEIEYEELAASPRTEVRKILQRLNLPPELAETAETGTAKMADAASSAWADRFRRERGVS
jgi:LPS sulfotransferase NodH